MKRLLFLCTGNSCRSHMGEGLLRHLAGDRYESLSAGSKPSGYVHPLAIQVMSEIGSYPADVWQLTEEQTLEPLAYTERMEITDPEGTVLGKLNKKYDKAAMIAAIEKQLTQP